MIKPIGKVRLILALLLVATLVLAGCGGGKADKKPADTATTGSTTEVRGTESQQVGAASQAESPQAVATPLRVLVAGADLISLKNIPFLLQDFYHSDNIDLVFQEYAGGADIAKALLGGDTVMAVPASQHVLRDPSGEMRIVATVTTSPGHALIVSSKYQDQVRSVADLKGKQVGVSSLGSATHQTLIKLLKRHNIDENDVIILPVGLDATESLANDEVQAAVTIEPFITEAVTSGTATVLVDTRTVEGTEAVFGTAEFPWICLVTTQEFIDRDPEAVQRVVSALVKTLQYMSTASPAEIIAKLPDAFRENEAMWIKMLQDNRSQFPKDGRISRQGLEAVWEDLQASGRVPADQPLPWESAVAPQFAEQAVSR